MTRKACVVGAGPNGLAAAIVLAQHGLQVEVFEAEPQPGGAARTLELTLPGFHHDFGSAVHPLGVGSPFFSSLPLPDYGLEWIHSPAPLAHPLDDGTAVMLERDLSQAQRVLGRDGIIWRGLMEPFVQHWTEFSSEVLRALRPIPRHPFLLGRFALNGLIPATRLVRRFHDERTKALFAGIAAHSFLSFDEPLSAAPGVLLGVAAHAVGWPIPKRGSQSITTALCRHLSKLGGTVTTSSCVRNLSELQGYDVTLLDVTPRQLLQLGSNHFTDSYKRRLEKYRYGPGVFKVDYALNHPIPWQASECSRASTVHVGGSFDEIAMAEHATRHGRHAERPFVLLAQPSLFDSTRAPQGKHTAWAYCHVPNSSDVDMLDQIERQIERFAPGFRDCILDRRVFSPSSLEKMDANLIGGDIGGGILDLRQFLFRPTWRHYATSARDIYICSSSTPPGGAVHGMCGYHAAQMALSRLRPRG
jgi:phytoene dehydrogenase-like protein